MQSRTESMSAVLGRQEERASAAGVYATAAEAEAWKEESGRAKAAAAEAQVRTLLPTH